MRQYRRNIVKAIILVLLASSFMLLSACTIVRHEEGAANNKQGVQFYFEDADFNPDEFVDSIWAEQVLPYIEENAADMNEVLQASQSDMAKAGEAYGHRSVDGSPWNFIVKSTAKIIAVNTESRAGTLELDLPPYDGAKDFSMQIGPVFKGSSVRDSLDFIKFDNFKNQIQYAQLGNAFNKKAYDESISKLDYNTLLNREIHFTGTFAADGSNILVVPIQIEAVKGGQ